MPTKTDMPCVVVTGVGLCTSLGNGREQTWDGLRNGKSGARWLDVEHEPGTLRYAGFPVLDNDHGPLEHVLKAAREALTDAEIRPNSDRVGVIVGLSKGDLLGLSQHYERLRREGVPPQDPFATAPSIAATRISTHWNFRGPCLAPIAACATGVVAALRGFDLIRHGVCDVAVIGAGDSSLQPLVLGAFRNMKAMAQVRDEPSRAIRPWDKARSGFLPGEGAAILVLEREDHAIARGVLPYCEFAGGAIGSDAFHMTNLNQTRQGWPI